MKKLLLTMGMSAALICTTIGTANAASYDIDPTHTYPNFTVSHLGFSTMHGQFGSTKGSLEMDLSAGTGSVDIVIDAASIYTGFKKRDDHLRSPDFFNVVEYPEITFKSTSAKLSGNSGTVKGDLTIMGVTKNVTLDVSNIKCGKHPFNPKLAEVCGFNATTSVMRTDFGMKYGIPAIGDKISIALEVEATR
ncbi:MAG: YceI family protein [Gammaproteobacteria bacterium]|nr:YceI family protein [Gammaproteobacteria bacterium]